MFQARDSFWSIETQFKIEIKDWQDYDAYRQVATLSKRNSKALEAVNILSNIYIQTPCKR